MPDKHEVGGSSPLGPTIELSGKRTRYKAKASFPEAKRRDKLITVVRVHLVLPEILTEFHLLTFHSSLFT